MLPIDELDKPGGVHCRHCESGKGCGIYLDRPDSCRGFYCGYLALPFVAPHWFPDDCGMVVFPQAAARRLAVHVDRANPDAWKAEPFHSDLRRWAVTAEKMGMQVSVTIGRRVIAILPHADVDLGEFSDGDSVVYDRRVVDGRSVLHARKVSASG
ncbi:MAG TPA: hypothetical protein VI168_07670 [Croceibacterium sp.]